ncbi:helix-turn-helix domain-containing protein [Actinomadura viridis]|uniref:DNA-binding XRE family transcriptional regulator n=1 Tax=Actinomadura viridis TaxID=58110 RepID=A0A931GPU8_9ACTN|nr:helix-turn-helix transcriptional regulator [Actinomadura viridis]MBG6091011.1 DNA-binding XRE family transcriptional regulator [Actinomadura viridis]
MGHVRWSDVREARRARMVGEIGEDAVRQIEAESRRRLDARVHGYHLAEERRAQGLTQAALAERMSVSKGRVSQIEQGKVSTLAAIAQYVEALGGHLRVVADFGDHTRLVAGPESSDAA